MRKQLGLLKLMALFSSGGELGEIREAAAGETITSRIGVTVRQRAYCGNGSSTARERRASRLIIKRRRKHANSRD